MGAENSFDPRRVRADFPIFSRQVHGKPLVYLDSAATAQKPAAVIESMNLFYREYNANVHRGAHKLSEEATAAYESVRVAAKEFLNAASEREIVFVRGATEGVNLVASSFGRAHVKPGDEIIISAMEHHSNIVPWQMMCEERGARLRVIPMDQNGELLLDEYEKMLSERTKIVAVVHQSNSLGTVNDVAAIARLAHRVGAKVLVDGAQSATHRPIDVRALDCDFFVLSGHKLFGPTGVGILYGRAEILGNLPPYHGGGDMIRSVTFEKTTYKEIPHRFEAGTPAIAEVIGLGAAIDYLRALDWTVLRRHEDDLLRYGTLLLSEIPGLRWFGTARNRSGILSFTLENAHPHDIATILDTEGVAIRAGHHCCQPVMNFYGISATARASLAFYNTREDLDALAAAFRKVKELFG